MPSIDVVIERLKRFLTENGIRVVEAWHEDMENGVTVKQCDDLIIVRDFFLPMNVLQVLNREEDWGYITVRYFNLVNAPQSSIPDALRFGRGPLLSKRERVKELVHQFVQQTDTFQRRKHFAALYLSGRVRRRHASTLRGL